MRKITSKMWLLLIGFFMSYSLIAQEPVHITAATSDKNCDAIAVVNKKIVKSNWTWHNGMNDSIIQIGKDSLLNLCTGEYYLKYFEGNDSKMFRFHIDIMNGNGGNNGGDDEPKPNGKPCQAYFKVNPLDTSGFKFLFKDASRVDTGKVLSYLWKIDGEIVNQNNSFENVFTKGMHTVSLTITTSLDCQDTYIDSASFPNFDNGGNNGGGENPNPCNGTNLNGYISSMIPSLGNECTGKFFVNVNGGMAPYEFHLKKMADSSFHRMNENPLFNELCAGEYLVIIKDKKGCEKRIPTKVQNDTSNVNNPCHGSPLTITFSSTNSTKLGKDKCDGSLIATVTGVDNYTFQWSNDLGSSSLEQTGLCPGDYKLSVTSNGCTRTERGIVKFGDMNDPCTGSTLESFIAYSLPSKPEKCTGKMALRVSGGALPYTFYVKGNNGNGAFTLMEPHFDSLCAGTYSIVVKDSLGCTRNLFGHIGKDSIAGPNHPCMNSNLSVSIAPTNVSSQGQCDGMVEATVLGADDYTFKWSNNLGSSNLTQKGLCPGLYKIFVTSNGCTIESAVKVGINLPTNPCVNSTLFATISTSNQTAVNTCDGSAFVTVSGGIAPIQYYWNTNDTTQAVSSLCPDTYRVKVKDAQGCVVVATGIVGKFIPTDVPRKKLRGHVIPTGETAIGACDGSASAIVHGGMEPYKYEFSNNSTESSTAYLCAGLNYVKVTDAKGDTLFLEFIITSPANTIENKPLPDSTVVDSIYSNVLENCNITFATITSAKIRDYHFVGTDSIAVNWDVISAGDTIKIVNIYGFSASSAGTYKFVIQLLCKGKSINDQLLTASDQVYLSEGNAAGLNEIEGNVVGIYPNPFTDHITVALENDQVSEVVIRDISGREVFNEKFNEKFIHIDMNAFTAGQYLISVRNNSTVVTRKMVK